MNYTSVTLEEIVALESQVWQALCTGNRALDAELLSDDFLGVYPSGFSDKQQHCDQLKNGPTVACYLIKEPRLTVLNENLVLLSYLAEWASIKNTNPLIKEYMYISSLWKRSGTTWQNTFSQDTPTPSK